MPEPVACSFADKPKPLVCHRQSSRASIEFGVSVIATQAIKFSAICSQ